MTSQRDDTISTGLYEGVGNEESNTDWSCCLDKINVMVFNRAI